MLKRLAVNHADLAKRTSFMLVSNCSISSVGVFIIKDTSMTDEEMACKEIISNLHTGRWYETQGKCWYS